MAIGYVLYNSLAGDREDVDELKVLEVVMDDELKFIDITQVKNYGFFFHH